MLKRLFRSVWFCPEPYLPLLAAALLMAPSSFALASTAASTIARPSPMQYPQSSKEVREAAPEMTPQIAQLGVQIDPLDSPHPIPWNWVLTTHTEVSTKAGSGVRYYRSPSLVSPDGQYAAYSRIKMEVQPDLFRSRVTSVMFLENLRTGDLRTISASSPLADNPFVSNEEADMPGIIAILIPVSWSKEGDRILARQFEGLFSTSDASDYAVVWDRKQNRTTTIAPNRNDYSNAVLLGWSRTNPDQVLFRAGELGEENWPLWAVDLDGQTLAAIEDQPLVFGQTITHSWAGPQAHY
ncbi:MULTISPECIES: hypothetical protein [unclassified Trichocoleus]|uniref:hypothetical protein n=2 Tax=Cyanobacteriota TaxID=1117 RepID=UPI0018EFC62B|nr:MULTISPECIES: hypothetical protein [unclassified Trichocoleus]